MRTEIIRIDPKNIDSNKLAVAAEVIRNNGTVVFPTETVYGLGGSAYSDVACRKIYAAKGRPADNPLIVHIAVTQDIFRVVSEDQDIPMEKLSKLWPAPLSVMLRKNRLVSDVCTAGLGTVVVRCPDNPIATELIRLSGVPIAAPSANLAGMPSIVDATDAILDLDGKVDVIIEGESPRYGLESTIIDLTSQPYRLMRPGAFTLEDLQYAFGQIVLQNTMEEVKVPLTPGMKYRHYSPKKVLYRADPDDLVELSRTDEGNKYAFLCSEETGNRVEGYKITLGKRGDLYTIAYNLFRSFRALDRSTKSVGIIETFPENGIGLAVMNRINKASVRFR